MLPIPDELWAGADRSQPPMAQLTDIFRHQPVGTRAFIDAILGGRPALPSFYDGWRAQEVIDAAIESHATGRQVAVRQCCGPEI